MKQSLVAQLFADEWPKLVATLVRQLGDIDLAEDAAQQAFIEAADKWGPETTPDKPGAWLMTTARRRAIDTIRRNADLRRKLDNLAADQARTGWFGAEFSGANIAPVDGAASQHQLVDDQLALIFGCCHPSLNREAQIGLTLRQVCGLSTRQIASAFFVPEATMAKRLVRAKDKIREAAIPFTVPDGDELSGRLDSVLAIIYLIYTEGHSAAEGASLIRGDLCDEARWLAGLVADLLANQAEALALSALLNLTDARRTARVNAEGELVLLADQDRSQWDHDLIEHGRRQLAAAGALNATPGPYQLQATIALTHAKAGSADDTNWARIVECYDLLFGLQPTAIVALNRAAAISQADGPAAGLRNLDDLDTGTNGDLAQYRYYHAARADMLSRLERWPEAEAAYRKALDLTDNGAERDFLSARIAMCGQPSSD